MGIAFYMTLTFAGILAKLWVLTLVKRSWRRSTLFILVATFIIIFLGQSTFELLLYFLDEGSGAGKAALIGYYLCAFICISLLPLMIAKLTRLHIPKLVPPFLIGLNGYIFYLLIASDSIISGVNHTGIALTRIAGEHYWFFQVSAIFLVISCLYILLHVRNSTDGFLKVRTNNLILSFALLAVFIPFVIVAMQFIDNLNAVGILPLLVALFVIGVVDNICNKHITDYSYWVPFSKKRREVSKLIKPFIQIQSDGLDLELKKEYNKLITQHALRLFNGNQTKAAEWLNVSQSWVSRNNKL